MLLPKIVTAAQILLGKGEAKVELGKSQAKTTQITNIITKMTNEEIVLK